MKQLLPNELYRQIISQLPRNTLYQCLYVNKAWHTLAAPLYYQEINVSFQNISQLKEYLQSENLNFHYGLYVKSLSLDKASELLILPGTPEDECLTPRELEILLSFTPNLKQVDFSYSPFKEEYISQFHQTKIHLPIEEFTCSAQGYDLQEASYFDLCYHYRNSLKHMHLFYNIYNELFKDKPVYFALPEFTELTHLTFYNDCDPELLLFDILDICPKLIFLRYTSYELIPDSASDRLDALLLKYNVMRAQTPSPLLHNQFLEHLEINVPVFTMPFVEYITYHTSPSLKTIRIKMMDDYLFDWIQSIGMENVLQLAKRMSLAKSGRIYSCPSEDIEKRPIQGPSKMTQFFQIANALKGERDLYCSFSCSDSPVNGCINEYAISVYHNYHLSLNYILDSEDWNDYALNMPDRDLSCIGFEIIHSFKLRMNQYVQTSLLDFMVFAFNHCPQMDFYEALYWENLVMIRCGKPSFCPGLSKSSKQLSKVNIACDSSLKSMFSEGINKQLPHLRSIQFFDKALLEAD